jgi:Sec-independent protein translocase protein TatA
MIKKNDEAPRLMSEYAWIVILICVVLIFGLTVFPEAVRYLLERLSILSSLLSP